MNWKLEWGRIVEVVVKLLLIWMVVASWAWADVEPNQVFVPPENGRVRKAYEGKGGRLVILLQELHNHYEAQLNNARILLILFRSLIYLHDHLN